MGYFEGLNFIPTWKDADGNTVFFPYGRFGVGRIVNQEQLAIIQWNYSIAVGTVSLGGVLMRHTVGILADLAFLAVLLGIFGHRLHLITRDLPISTLRPNSTDAGKKVLRAYGPLTCWVSIGVGLFVAYKLATLIGQRGFLSIDLIIAASAAMMVGVGALGVIVCWRK
jgi:hypothetical protein